SVIMDFLADIQEKEVGAVKAPSFPQPKANGFPEHKKRTRTSAFKQQRQGANGSSLDGQDVSKPPQPPSSESASTARSEGATGVSQEKKIIQEEVNSMLASMSPEEIEEQRRDLLENMNPAILQMLLKRANLDDQSSAAVFDEPSEPKPKPDAPKFEDAPAIQVVDDTTSAKPPPKADKPRKTVRFDEDAPPPEPPADLFEAGAEPPRPSKPEDTFAPNTTHFPQPKALPDLDPADPNFLETLHE
ncbi:hypothetical protein N0V82_010884, partial [Gnomoniopsis sp. IMI 355080]